MIIMLLLCLWAQSDKNSIFAEALDDFASIQVIGGFL